MNRGVSSSLAAQQRRRELFPEARDEEWNDWRWQLQHALRDEVALARALALDDEELAHIRESRRHFRMAISPHYACLMDPAHRYCPVRMQAVPSAHEAHVAEGELRDPLGEDKHRPTRALVHKYPDRALLLVTDICPVYCRHCTRRRITAGGEAVFDGAALEEAYAYLREHAEIREVIISGGDPLLLSDERLAAILTSLRSIPHLEVLRVGTRIPVTLPMRVTEALAALLRTAAPLYVITHFNHPKEVTPESRAACERLVDHGVPVENQSVLMRRLNSDPEIIRELNLACLAMRVRPYYLHQMDVAEGCEHLRTPLSTGLDIIAALRGYSSGLAVPHFAVDLPGGGGKVTLTPNYRLESPPSQASFRNYRNERYDYPDVAEAEVSCPYQAIWRASR